MKTRTESRGAGTLRSFELPGRAGLAATGQPDGTANGAGARRGRDGRKVRTQSNRRKQSTPSSSCCGEKTVRAANAGNMRDGDLLSTPGMSAGTRFA